MMEFYFPKLKKKVKAKPVSGKAYRARGGSVRYGLQAMHDGAKSLPKYVSREEYGRLGFSAEQADSELPAYVPKVAYAEESPVPASPLEDAPSASPEPAEPTNANFSAEDDEEARMLDETHSDIRDYYTPKTRTFVVSSVDYETDGEELDLPQDFTFTLDEYDTDYLEGSTDMQEIAELLVDNISDETGWLVQGFYFQEKMPDGTLVNLDAEYKKEYGAEIEGVVDYTRREMKDITVDQDVSQTYTVDTDPEDIPENKMDKVEQAISDEIEGIASSDPASHDNVLNDISVYTLVEVPDEDGDMVEVSAYGYTNEPMINNEENIRENTNYESFYSESENSIHQFKGESTSCCDAETYRYKSEGDWLCMACDEFQAEFSPEELAKSSAIHGDFDHASINYSGHQNLLARAETVMKDGVYRTTCDCGTVLKWDEYVNAITKDGKMIPTEDMSVERLEFPSRIFDHFEEELSIKCPTCGEYHICYIEAPVYHDRLKVDFGAETESFEAFERLTQGYYDNDERFLVFQSNINLDDYYSKADFNENSPYFHSIHSRIDDALKEYNRLSQENHDKYHQLRRKSDGGFIMKGEIAPYLREDNYYAETESLIEEPDFIPEGDGRAFGQQNSSINLSPLHAESEGMSRNAKMALGFTAIGLGIAAWKGKELVSLFDNLKEQIKKMTDK